ncbi:MAG: YdcF family protein [Nitrospiraceae bacterium]|nr:YdcF family protein [Nitrospiraceae bacterium]
MFIFKKAVSPFLLPPGIFIVVLIGSGLFIWRKSWKAGMVNIMIGLLMWSLSMNPVSVALMRGLETGLEIPKHPRGDVIILLGGGLHGNLPSEDTFARIVAAAKLYKVLHVPVIISGGAAYRWKQVEAPVDARFLINQGVPAEKIILENKSRDTLENARYSKEICESHHFKRPVLVTSAYHMERALLIFRHMKMHVTAFPAWSTEGQKTYGWASYLPRDFGDSNAALHEYLGIVYQKLLFEMQKI